MNNITTDLSEFERIVILTSLHTWQSVIKRGYLSGYIDNEKYKIFVSKLCGVLHYYRDNLAVKNLIDYTLQADDLLTSELAAFETQQEMLKFN